MLVENWVVRQRDPEALGTLRMTKKTNRNEKNPH